MTAGCTTRSYLPLAVVICDTYRQGAGYQENAWKSTLKFLGWNVVSIGAVSSASPGGSEEHVCLAVTRVRRRVTPTEESLAGLVLEADLVLAFGNRSFAEAVLARVRKSSTRSIAFFQEHSSTEPGVVGQFRSIAKPIWYRMMLRPAAVRLLKEVSEVVLNTPDTADFMAKSGVPRELLINASLLPLGVAPGQFEVDCPRREKKRLELSLADSDRLVVATGVFHERKRSAVDLTCRTLRSFLARSEQHFAVLVGLPLIGSTHPRLRTLPRSNQAGLSSLYNAADAALFMQPSIGIQQAMSTGCPVVAPIDSALTHLGQYGVIVLSERESMSEALAVAATGGTREEGLERSLLRYENQAQQMGLSLGEVDR